ncbi:MAG TPA: hypothetical protein VD763_12345 [Candidatus Saccharimonadales bacterium]|nr:hypothetical protein [Candidatus Saccharimonadales bacterium]
MPPTDVTVLLLHPEPGPAAGSLVAAVGAARLALAERHSTGFRAAGATEVRLLSGPPDDTPFGRRLRDLARAARRGGIVVLGSGAIPLATADDRRCFVQAAAASTPGALANNRYSADVVAIAAAHEVLADLPDLAADNELPRWLEESAGIPVTDLRRRWRLGIDIDGPLDLVLLGDRAAAGLTGDVTGTVRDRLDRISNVASDHRAELVVAGRTSASTLAWLERSTAARTRALVEERGLRTSRAGQRPPVSTLGLLLDRDGPAAFGAILARLGEAAIVDTRVLLAHRAGPDERAWPTAEDRFASDLLLPDRIVDPWLRDLTASAVSASVPILLGGHTLVGPGLRLALGRARP